MTMRVQQLHDLKSIQDFLEIDRLWSAYALGDLDPELNAMSEWYGAQEGDALQSLALLFKGFDPPALFTMGDARGVAVILDAALRAPDVYLNVPDAHMAAIRAHYVLRSHEPMWRMILDAQAFRAVRGAVVHLTPQYTRELEELYLIGGGNAFTARQMLSGAFYGVEQFGQLIAAAGTHVVSEMQSAAAVGNVFTHPEYRGHGYATLATSAVCADLIRRGMRTIVLNVAQTNDAAIRIYERLGFRKYMPFNEGVASRA